MEGLLGLGKLQKELEKQLGILTGDDDKSGDQNIKSAIRLLYDSSRQRIFHVADNMSRGMIRPGEVIKYVSEVKEPELPEEEIWDFQLGDAVTVKYSREDFKRMQQKTLGWNERLNQIYGHVGVVNNVYTEYENSIGVYFPDQYAGCTLYAGLLKKVPFPEYPNLHPQWKVGQYVKTVAPKKTLKLLQRGLDQLSKKDIGVRARVVAVTHPCILVTFDEMKTYDLKSASLVPCKDQSPIEKKEISHARGFKIGEEIKVKSNLKNLIKNQKEFGGWNTAMCDIRGKKATVIHMQEDGSLNVQLKHSRAWRLNPDSALHLDEDETEEDDFKFLPGDIIRIIVPSNIRAILAMIEVSPVFLEFLRATAVLSFVDDDLDNLVRFNADQNIQVDDKLLRKATTSEKQKYESIEKKVKELKVGDKVHLDIGPPNFIQAMIRELDLHPNIAMAMVKSATLIGFVNSYQAVIEYENSTKFRVKKRYLTVPEKFHVDESKDAISPFAISRIYNAIMQSVEDIHSRENAPTEDWKVDTTFMSRGNPPCVEYKIESTVASFKAVFDWLDQNSGWGIEKLSEGQLLLRNVEAADREVKVGVIFNDDQSVFDVRDDHVVQGFAFSHAEEGTAKLKAEPIREGGGQPAEPAPVVENLDQFQYIKLFNASLARNVYFPYVIHGPTRTPVQPAQNMDEQRRGPGSTVYNIQNVGHFSNA